MHIYQCIFEGLDLLGELSSIKIFFFSTKGFAQQSLHGDLYEEKITSNTTKEEYQSRVPE
jgi:hypothetical protein